jgi:hypothetical protein
LVNKAKTVPIHFTLEVEGPNEIIMDEKSTWIPTWQTINNISLFAGICGTPTSNNNGSQILANMSMVQPLDENQGPRNYMVTTLGSWVK